MEKLLVLLLVAAVVAVASAATKDEMMAKKMAFKKGKKGAAHPNLDEIAKLKGLNLPQEEFQKRMGEMKHSAAKKTAPKPKAADKIDTQGVAHKKKYAEDVERAKRELEATKKEFQQEIRAVRSENTSNRQKQRKMIGMKQDFMAKVSDLKERMGLDPSKTDKMAWKQAQLKKRGAVLN